jgi:hypothetical protein
MKKTKHTPEPWKSTGADQNDEYGVWSVDGRNCIAEGLTAANARRIVACVNACAGIPTEVMEIPDNDPRALQMDRLRIFYARLEAAQKGCIDLESQRDELLAALKALYGWTKAEVEHFGATCPDDFIIEMVEKALKNA